MKTRGFPTAFSPSTPPGDKEREQERLPAPAAPGGNAHERPSPVAERDPPLAGRAAPAGAACAGSSRQPPLARLRGVDVALGSLRLLRRHAAAGEPAGEKHHE